MLQKRPLPDRRRASCRKRCAFWRILLLLVWPAALQAQFNYTTNNGTITITGYTGPGGEVVIPEMINGLPVTSIGMDAFAGCVSLTGISIPNTVTNIEGGAFMCCVGLTTLRIPGSVRRIGSYWSEMGPPNDYGAFTDCTSLQSLVLEDGVSEIDDVAFAGCSSLTRVEIPDSVTSLGVAAFSGCTSLTNVVLGRGISTIPGHSGSICGYPAGYGWEPPEMPCSEGAFAGCLKLQDVVLSNTLTNIEDGAFAGCRALTRFAIPDGVRTICHNAFGGCSGLTNVALGTGLRTIDGGAFNFCTGLRSISIPANVTSMGVSVFCGCTELREICVDSSNPAYCSVDGVLFDKNQKTLLEFPCGKGGSYVVPSTTSTIGVRAFYGSAALTSITIPRSVVAVQWLGLAYCPTLITVTVESALCNIDEFAFAGCSNLTSVYFYGDAPSAKHYVFGYPAGCTATHSVVYYLPGTANWGSSFGGNPTALWHLPNPRVLMTARSLGLSTNGLGFRISWATNSSVVVEACSELANSYWTAVSTNALVSGWADFRDPSPAAATARFYRVRGL